jgi:hypothetical protein
MHNNEGVGGEYNCRLKHFARMRERLIHTALANNGDFDQLLLCVQKNDSKPLPIEKTHFGTELGNCLGTVDGERLTLLPQRYGAHPERANQSKGL